MWITKYSIVAILTTLMVSKKCSGNIYVIKFKYFFLIIKLVLIGILEYCNRFINLFNRF